MILIKLWMEKGKVMWQLVLFLWWLFASEKDVAYLCLPVPWCQEHGRSHTRNRLKSHQEWIEVTGVVLGHRQHPLVYPALL